MLASPDIEFAGSQKNLVNRNSIKNHESIFFNANLIFMLNIKTHAAYA